MAAVTGGNGTGTVLDFNDTFRASIKDGFSAQRCSVWNSDAFVGRSGEPVS